jgi:hypothetical protein
VNQLSLGSARNTVRPAAASLAIAGIASALLLSLPQPARAQQSELDTLRQQIQALQQRLDALEAEQKKAADAAAKAGPPSVQSNSKQQVTVSGLLQVQGSANLSESGPTFPRQADTFRIRRGELRLTSRITPRITGTIMIDPAKPSRLNPITVPAGGGTVTPTVNQSSNVFQELMLSYQLNQRPTSSLFVDAGQFKIPIGYEGDLVSSGSLQTINRALMFSVRDPFAGGYGDIRESGARLRGSSGPLGYELGVFNGFGERQNDVALGDPKAVIGRLQYRPRGVEGLVLGASGGIGNTAVTAGAPRSDRSQWNLFSAYKRNKLTFQTEYLQGDAQIFGGLGGVRDVRSYYGSVGYLFRPKLEGVFRYDTFDANRNASAFDLSELIFGLNYYIKGNNAKIQTNLIRRNGVGSAAVLAGANPTGIGGLRNDNTSLVTQLQVAF